MNLKEVASKNLKTLRLKSGLSQRQLADRVGKSVRYISALENSAPNMTLEIIELLAMALGVSVGELFFEHQENTDLRAAKAAARDFEEAIQLLNRYRVNVERLISPPKRIQ